ncbi:MAG: hypothetical protein Q9160_003629 [Pyrenula sp. 1 TL-2023]
MSSDSERASKRKRDFFDELYSLDDEDDNSPYQNVFEPSKSQRSSKCAVSKSNENVKQTNTEVSRQSSIARRTPEESIATESGPRKLFHGLNFYFIPNDDKSPARRFRIKKAQQFGAVWIKTWSTEATHVIVDRGITLPQVLKHLGLQSVPGTTDFVTENYPAECMGDGIMKDPQRSRFRLKGSQISTTVTQEKDSMDDKARPDKKAQLAGAASSNHNEALHGETLREGARTRGFESEQETKLGDDSGLHATSLRHQDNDKEQPAKDLDPLDNAIAEARTMGSIPLDLEEDEKASFTVSDEDDSGADLPVSKKPVENKRPSKAGALQCMQKNDGKASSKNPNERTIYILQQMCEYYTRTNDTWRSYAYRRAIIALRNQPHKITSAAAASQIPHIGTRLALKIEEIVTTDRLQRLENTSFDSTDRTLQLFTGIYQVGFSQANTLIAKGHRTLSDLAASPTDLTPNQRIGLAHYTDFQQRIPRAEVQAIGSFVRNALATANPALQTIIGGSYRRGALDSGDVDLIITRDGTTTPSQVRDPVVEVMLSHLHETGFLKASFTSTAPSAQPSKWHGACALPASHNPNPTLTQNQTPPWRRLDLLFVPSTSLGAALIYFTGNDIFNRSIRLLASRKGMRLNQHGLFEDVMRGPGRKKVTEGRLVEGRDERRIFEVLGVPWRGPGERIC